MRKKKSIIIASTILGLILLIAAAYLSTAKYAQKKVESLLTERLAKLGWEDSNVEVNTLTTTPCLKLHSQSILGSSLKIEEACIVSGLSTLFSDAPKLKVKIVQITADLDIGELTILKDKLRRKSDGKQKIKLPGHSKELSFSDIELELTVAKVETKIIDKDKKDQVILSLLGAQLLIKDKTIQAHARVQNFVSSDIMAVVKHEAVNSAAKTKALSFAFSSPDAQTEDGIKAYLHVDLDKMLGNARLELGDAKQEIQFRDKELEAELNFKRLELKAEEETLQLALLDLVLDIPRLRIDEASRKTSPQLAKITDDDRDKTEDIAPNNDTDEDDVEALQLDDDDDDDDDDAVESKDEDIAQHNDSNAEPTEDADTEEHRPEIARCAKLTLDIDRAHLVDMLEGTSRGASKESLHKLIRELRLDSPVIQVEAKKIIQSQAFSALPGAQTLLSYWSRSAGSLLGGAPKKSTKSTKDQKRSKTSKNPIPPEMMTAFRDGFKRLQGKLLGLPPIDIIDGTIKIFKNHRAFTLNSLSFKTRDLMSDDQKMHFDFIVGDARASFDIAFDEGSIYPRIQLDIDKLSATSFYKFINMPIPKAADGTFFGSLLFKITDSKLSVDTNLRFEDFAFYHERISPNLVYDIEVSAKMKFIYIFENDLLSIDDVELRSGPITAMGTMRIDNLRSYPVIHIDLAAQDIPCKAIEEAIPPGLLPTITQLQMDGSAISPSIKAKIPWKDPLKLSIKEKGFTNDCYPVSVAPHHPEVLNAPDYIFTTHYTYFVEAIEVGPGTADYTPIANIPPYVLAAMFLTEDKRFLEHGPLRLSFIERAMRLNLNARKYIYGGSTISQQLVKNLFLDRRKNLARKLEEWFITWHMETVVTKTRILELYLNVIEFGPDVYGIKQGAKFYFDKEPSALTPLEGAYLASLKVAPSKGGRFYYSGFPKKRWWHKRMRYIIKVLAENGYISMTDALDAYPWIPEFVYPDEDDALDARNVWLENYGKANKYRRRAKR